MSSSLSNDERAERIAEIERTMPDLVACIALSGMRGAAGSVGIDVKWLLSELRSALQREAAWKAAHDRQFCGSLPSREE